MKLDRCRTRRGPWRRTNDLDARRTPHGCRARSGEEYFAFEDICTHDGAELTGGRSKAQKSFARVMARGFACERAKR